MLEEEKYNQQPSPQLQVCGTMFRYFNNYKDGINIEAKEKEASILVRQKRERNMIKAKEKMRQVAKTGPNKQKGEASNYGGYLFEWGQRKRRKQRKKRREKAPKPSLSCGKFGHMNSKNYTY